MLVDWTAEAVGRMHTARITGRMLAKECGYSEAYVSVVLNGKRGTDKTRQNIMDAISRIEAKQNPARVEAVQG